MPNSRGRRSLACPSQTPIPVLKRVLAKAPMMMPAPASFTGNDLVWDGYSNIAFWQMAPTLAWNASERLSLGVAVNIDYQQVSFAQTIRDTVTGARYNFDLARSANAFSAFAMLLAMVAALLDVMVISDISGVVDADTFERPIYAGKAMETVLVEASPAVATLRPNSVAADESGATPEVETVALGADYAAAASVTNEAMSSSERPDVEVARTDPLTDAASSDPGPPETSIWPLTDSRLISPFRPSTLMFALTVSTSSSAVAFQLPDGGWVIDTPGVRSFGLAHVDVNRVLHAFADLEPGAQDCPRGCDHLVDSCALDAWVASGHAHPDRLASLRRLLASREAVDRLIDAHQKR